MMLNLRALALGLMLVLLGSVAAQAQQRSEREMMAEAVRAAIHATEGVDDAELRRSMALRVLDELLIRSRPFPGIFSQPISTPWVGASAAPKPDR